MIEIENMTDIELLLAARDWYILRIRECYRNLDVDIYDDNTRCLAEFYYKKVESIDNALKIGG